MARRAVIKSLVLNKACRISINRTPIPNSRCRHGIISNIRDFCSRRQTDHPNNMVFGSTVIDGSTGEWLTLNEQINTYPSARKFTAIGTGGDDFVRSMVVAVESVIRNPVQQGYVRQRVSSGGKYVSVNIGPVRVISREQVQAVYNAMRSDDRMKFFL